MNVKTLAKDGIEDQMVGTVVADLIRAANRKRKALEEEEKQVQADKQAKEGEEVGTVTPGKPRPSQGIAPEPEPETPAKKKTEIDSPIPAMKPRNRQIGHLMPEAKPKHPEKAVRMLDDKGKVHAVDKGNSLSIVRRAQRDEKTILAVLTEAKTRWPDKPLMLAGSGHFMQNAMRIAVDQGIAVEVPNATHRKHYEKMLAEKQAQVDKQSQVEKQAQVDKQAEPKDRNFVQKMEMGSVRPIDFPPPARIEDATDRQITGKVHGVSEASDGRKTVQLMRLGKPLSLDVPDSLDIKAGQQIRIEKAKDGQVRAIDTRAKEKEISK